VASEPLVHDDNVEVWPDCWRAVHTFVQLSTQWRIVALPSGAQHLLGLDYGVIPAVLELAGVPREEWSDVFADLRVMEQAALEKINA
jgi:hypothetical protein